MDNSVKDKRIDDNIMMLPRLQYNYIMVKSEAYSQLRKFFIDLCTVIVETTLFLTKDNPREIKKDFVKLKELISSKEAEVVPDIAVYCDNEQIFKRGFIGIPELIVEVLSPNSHIEDALEKYKLYESYGVPEYWSINPESKEVFVYTMENENYELVAKYDFLREEIRSDHFKDLRIDLRYVDLYGDENEMYLK